MLYQLLTLTLLTLLTTAQVPTPFHFKLLSNTNATLNNTSLYACHSGAAESSLCWSPHALTTQFLFTSLKTNYSALPSPTADIGKITHNFTYANGWAWQIVNLAFDPVTNIALPGVNFRSGFDVFGFDGEGLLVIWAARDERGGFLPVRRAVRWWAVCEGVTWSGYRYTMLSWVVGGGVPVDLGCWGVNVTRVFEGVEGVVVPDGGRG
ncbi:hypothetical protein EG328_002298 [Venturia inaequalis]|uniref:DUF7907 domain-containing protein n=1 Tax=Venturia inaequalis TaxID=5025 RepID=A0A8H3UYE5_VENIN|nr:hypothetical protein EG328_002298 [Venturia inaequalis]KAE9981261.1 hypothetical protein EG327_006272 [Venturia inaequalis]RDI78689.1 Metal resistance protein [Venturia inaequalis]